VPIFATGLKDPVASAVVRALLREADAGVVLTPMGFSAGGEGNALDDGGRVVLEAVQSLAAREDWDETTSGLGVRDLAMHVVTPEFDGRIMTRAFAFKERGARDPLTGAFPVHVAPEPSRVAFVSALAAAHARLRLTPSEDKRVALILANYPGRDGRIANGVGLDTPASTINLLKAMAADGYRVAGHPQSSAALMEALIAARRAPPARLSLQDYEAWFATLPEGAQEAVSAQWGPAGDDPTLIEGAFAIAALRFGNALVAIQPARGYERDIKATYHDPALVPTHAYLAFYLYVREAFGAHAAIHVGKHGNMEWLPGKATALSDGCWPEIAFGALPHLYPFIVNDPGEGTQAKRRAQAVIVDHLTPPMTTADSHGIALSLEPMIDEYALARTVDPKRAERLAVDIVDVAERSGLCEDLALASGEETDAIVAALDAHLCDLKELQIRDGLHILGESPAGEQRRDTLASILRAPRGTAPEDASILRAVAADFGCDFDPLDADLAAPWDGPRPTALDGMSAPWRTAGDTVERLQAFVTALLEGTAKPGPKARAVLEAAEAIGTSLDASGAREIAAAMGGLRGTFTPPGPSGAPTRGRPDVLPTGRNFFAVDIRGIPTPTAWQIGAAAAERVVDRYVMEEGEWPRAIVLTCWGTANMRTGGDDIAQALALIGAEPVWDGARLTGFSERTLGAMGRPRVDVTLRVSGFFRDAFPEQILLFDSAARAVAARDEPDDQNPLRARFTNSDGGDISVFGAMPGAYGAGLQALIDTGSWQNRSDLAEAFIAWGRYGYGKGRTGETAEGPLRARLAGIDAVVQAQDNREHDILDSDDYYQFEGGLAAAVEAARGRAPVSLHVDTSRAERPVARTLKEEIARVVRARAANPKWIKGVMRHGYKGAFEMAATLDYLFAFAATTNAVADHHFDQLYDAYLEDEAVADFIAEANHPALQDMVARFREAMDRGLWAPRKNSVHARLDQLARCEES
ncbi:MAG: cobaltochelatase subunit CobN, partial [Pseudomonadota bacterium]